MANNTPPTLLREARRRAGLTQRELAKCAGMTQSAVARIERSHASPTYSTLSRLLDAAGFTLDVKLLATPVFESHMLDDVARIKALTPSARLTELGNASPFFASAKRV